MVFTDTKVTYQAYCHNRLGYDVVCLPKIMMNISRVYGGVVLVVWDQPKGWIVESTRLHRLNMARSDIFYGGKQTRLIGAYFPPYTLEHLPNLERELI